MWQLLASSLCSTPCQRKPSRAAQDLRSAPIPPSAPTHHQGTKTFAGTHAFFVEGVPICKRRTAGPLTQNGLNRTIQCRQEMPDTPPEIRVDVRQQAIVAVIGAITCSCRRFFRWACRQQPAALRNVTIAPHRSWNKTTRDGVSRAQKHPHMLTRPTGRNTPARVRAHQWAILGSNQ